MFHFTIQYIHLICSCSCKKYPICKECRTKNIKCTISYICKTCVRHYATQPLLHFKKHLLLKSCIFCTFFSLVVQFFKFWVKLCAFHVCDMLLLCTLSLYSMKIFRIAKLDGCSSLKGEWKHWSCLKIQLNFIKLCNPKFVISTILLE